MSLPATYDEVLEIVHSNVSTGVLLPRSGAPDGVFFADFELPSHLYPWPPPRFGGRTRVSHAAPVFFTPFPPVSFPPLIHP